MICYGTFRRNHDLIDLVPLIVNRGIRLFETAGYYHNINYLVDGIKKSGLKSEQYRIFYRFTNYNIDPINHIERLLSSYNNINQFDVLINKFDLNGKWIKIADSLYSASNNCIRSIGTSNFKIDQLEIFKNNFGFYPEFNSFESHPYYPQLDLINFCKKNNITPMFNCSIGRGRELNNSVIEDMSKKYKISPMSVLLFSAIPDGIPIFTTGDSNHISQMDNICMINKEDIKKIRKLSYPEDYGRVIKNI